MLYIANHHYTLGIDFGTSGARAVVIDCTGVTQAEAKYAVTDDAFTQVITWENTLFNLIEQIPPRLRQQIDAIAIDGTSSTVLLCNATGTPVAPPLMYNDARGVTVLEQLKAIAPPNHTVLSATSSLAKLLWLSQQPTFADAKYFLHQADWLAFLLHGKLGISDYHNALKLGYDVEHFCYPAWLTKLAIAPLLPQILAPGTPVAEVTPEVATRFNLRRDCYVCAGTTDSIAAFLASGATSPGEAVTSLGSTMVLKLLSHTRVENSQYGIYSHRLGDLWLTGGASNTGGAVLQQFFSNAELQQLSLQIDPQQVSPFDYYPLLQPGDRFPVNDPHLLPRLEPRPDNSVEFLHGILESIARIECQGYQLLQQLGATSLIHIYTAGGGAVNTSWTAIRQRYFDLPIVASKDTEAAYGSALLAMRSINSNRN
ncbi:FGGY-family carbohydrate kinase [Gloeocapsopsis dulcis]|uniref:D-ribulose kinase n=1 Tax=Gloeocapsopsis dulcis AAB1 = 1H9 TaxID=1433147 RepID=A0A6N8G0F1_9CHRO|nr:FGGY-family carbohydrate kinase [Gloeocapsopsis dulcis]MUL38474.1 carbohydrate kinase [Gloeocapsopsis dulcis AAB1 = 1H9]WNN88834.1 FGGY-family carbohydrate kinase [Gloeocapsopsis dulcis]